jgi:hypothetical protein
MIEKKILCIVFIWFACFVNCFTSEIIVHKKPDTSFNKYSAILIEVDDNGITNGYSVGNQIRFALQAKLASNFKPEVFISNSASFKKINDSLIVTLRIFDYKEGNKQGMRAGYASFEKIELEVEFIDTKTKSIQSKFLVHEEGFVITTDQMVEIAAEKIANFILEN